jgi:hypothetical protein
VISQELNFHSTEWMQSVGRDGLPIGIKAEAEQQLTTWKRDLDIVKEWISPEHWRVGNGLAVPDIQYAALAFAYQHRATMNPGLVAELLAQDMKVPLTTTKERIRKTRAKGFLSSPGKGLVGQGKIEMKATQLLRKEGLI